jgi:glucosyl-3-phosphoglycerate synthase
MMDCDVMAGQLRSFHHRDFDAAALVAAKRGRRVSVCLPARDEEATVGPIVARVRCQLVERVPLVDEIVVVDDGSRDRTATCAADAGARVVPTDTDGGKGGALQTAVAAATGDLLVFCDADVRDFNPRFVVGLAGPLLLHDDVDFVKGFYERNLDRQPRGGGRVTQLVARPLLTLLFPELAGVVQPLAGEFGARRWLLERLPFVEGYGVDIGLLIDAARTVGVARMAQVDLGVRVHRNRPLAELGPMATVVLQTALRRARVPVPEAVVLRSPDAGDAVVTYRERPPLAVVPTASPGGTSVPSEPAPAGTRSTKPTPA